MSDQMERLGRMVDEALAETDARPEMASVPRTATGGHVRTIIGGGTSYQAVEDICWIYQNRNLAENLRRHGWRQARRNVMHQGPLSKEWMSHRGRSPVRLTRKGVEIKLANGIQTLSWKHLQSQVGARRS